MSAISLIYGRVSGASSVPAVADYVLDTHACVFALAAPNKLGQRARRALKRAEIERKGVWIPAAAAAEIVLLHELGRMDLGLPALRAACDRSASWHVLPLDIEQIDEFASLAAIRDPFDRLIVAAARRLRAKLITRDALIEQSGLVETIWS
jgi:PIN domain nuclease of toxin-antitoxin system